jgi:hypothetical protein
LADLGCKFFVLIGKTPLHCLRNRHDLRPDMKKKFKLIRCLFDFGSQ